MRVNNKIFARTSNSFLLKQACFLLRISSKSDFSPPHLLEKVPNSLTLMSGWVRLFYFQNLLENNVKINRKTLWINDLYRNKVVFLRSSSARKNGWCGWPCWMGSLKCCCKNKVMCSAVRYAHIYKVYRWRQRRGAQQIRGAQTKIPLPCGKPNSSFAVRKTTLKTH